MIHLTALGINQPTVRGKLPNAFHGQEYVFYFEAKNFEKVRQWVKDFMTDAQNLNGAGGASHPPTNSRWSTLIAELPDVYLKTRMKTPIPHVEKLVSSKSRMPLTLAGRMPGAFPQYSKLVA